MKNAIRKTYDEMVWRLTKSPLYRRSAYDMQQLLVRQVKRAFLAK